VDRAGVSLVAKIASNGDTGRMNETHHEQDDLEAVARLTGERRRFLAAVASICPSTLTALAGEPLEAFQRIVARDAAAIAGRGADGAHSISIDAIQNHVRAHTLRRRDDLLVTGLSEAIDRWSRRFRLTDEWLIDSALQTLAGWTFFQSWSLEPKSFFYQIFPKRGPVEFPPFLVRIEITDYWRLWAGEDRSFARHRIETAFKHRLRVEFDRIEAYAKAAGYMYTSPKMGKLADKHYRWLARRVVERVTYEQIAREAEPETDPPTVHETIRRTAEIVGLSAASLR
jgi:hypothetical protein